MKIIHFLNKAGLNGFFFMIIFMVVLAWYFPFYGTKESPLPLNGIITYGISAIFFFYGLRLSAAALWSGLSNWKLHVVIQSTTFILFPLIVLICYFFFFNEDYKMWWLGAFYLAALPSTVSSSVVMISMAGGNLSGGIFNASISSIIGIVITPLWMSLFITQWNETIDSYHVIVSLCIQVLAPLIVGLILHQYIGHLAEKYKNQLRYFDQTIILLIVYRAFCESFAGNMFEGFTITEITFLSLLMLIFFLIMMGLMQVISSALRFSREDRITILFCGSKKSLVQGAVMGPILFTNPLLLGIIFLPLMLYHSLQLLIGSVLAQRFGRR